MRIAQLLKSTDYDSQVVVKGWVRTKRGNKNVAFIALNDGSCVANIQIVVDLAKADEDILRQITTGACICVEGQLVKSLGQGQGVEVQAEKIEIYGTADPESYPLQKKGHSLEFLRDIAYLRPRTNTFGAILRIRHAMAPTPSMRCSASALWLRSCCTLSLRSAVLCTCTPRSSPLQTVRVQVPCSRLQRST